MSHTVLLIEDEEDLRETMREFLELNGYPVVAVTDGQQALDEIGSIPDLGLVLLDLIMPRMNGWDFITKLRAQAAYQDTPVVVHSSAPGDPPKGVAGMLRKPIQIERLLAVVEEFCAP